MKDESVVGKVFEGLVMMAIHVALEEVEDGRVHQIRQPTTLRMCVGGTVGQNSQ